MATFGITYEVNQAIMRGEILPVAIGRKSLATFGFATYAPVITKNRILWVASPGVIADVEYHPNFKNITFTAWNMSTRKQIQSIVTSMCYIREAFRVSLMSCYSCTDDRDARKIMKAMNRLDKQYSYRTTVEEREALMDANRSLIIAFQLDTNYEEKPKLVPSSVGQKPLVSPFWDHEGSLLMKGKKASLSSNVHEPSPSIKIVRLKRSMQKYLAKANDIFEEMPEKYLQYASECEQQICKLHVQMELAKEHKAETAWR